MKTIQQIIDVQNKASSLRAKRFCFFVSRGNPKSLKHWIASQKALNEMDSPLTKRHLTCQNDNFLLII